MIEYLKGCLIAFIIIVAILNVFRENLSRYNYKGNKTEFETYFYRAGLALIPFLREFMMIVLVVMAFMPDDKVNEINRMRGN